MPLFNWLARSIKRAARGTKRKLDRRGRVFLRVEPLEDRTVPTTFYVAPSGADAAGRGTTPTAPFANPQFAIDAAQSGDTIKLAAGTYGYVPSYDPFVATGGTTGVLAVINKQLTILGGYLSSDFFHANPAANVTIIDGGLNVRGVLVVGQNAPTSLDLEGVTVQNGFAQGNPLATGSDRVDAFGGGLFIDMGAQPNNSAPFVVRNVIFRNNQSRGAATNSSVGGTGAGGGLALRLANNVTLDTDTFTSNFANGGTGPVQGGYAMGGGVFADRSTVLGINLTFQGNVVLAGFSMGTGSQDGTLTEDALGAGVAIQGITGTATGTFIGVTATRNEAIGGNAAVQGGGGFGGAFYADAANLSLTYGNLQQNIVQGGTGQTGGLSGGGGVASTNANVTIDRTILTNNVSSGGQASSASGIAGSPGGGGAYFTNFTGGHTGVSVTNSLLSDNLVQFAGQGQTQTVLGGGGGAWLQGVTANFIQDTIANNVLAPNVNFGMGLVLLNDGAVTPTVANVAYTILADHNTSNGFSAAIHQQANTTVNLSRNLFANNTFDFSNLGPVTINGAATDLPDAPSPGFVSPGTPNFNYNLMAGSPAINQGTNSTATVDITGNPRVGVPDIGAYEYHPPILQFAGATFTTPKNGGIGQIAITRGGDITISTSVTLTTSNGTAVAGRDYADATQTVTFAPGQTTQNINVTILNDNVATGNLQIDLGLSNPGSGAILGFQSQAVLTILDVFPNDNTNFVNRIYSQLLIRPLDGAGSNFFLPPLESARNAVLPSIVAGIDTSQEYLTHLLADPTTGYIPRYLGRPATQADLNFFLGAFAQGATNEQVQASILGSQEYFNHVGGTALAWLQATFQNLLGRPLDPASQTAYLNEINGGANLSAVALQIMASSEYLGRLVDGYFTSFLHRPDSQTERNFWIGALQGGTRDEQAINAIAGSAESLVNNTDTNVGWVSSLYEPLLGRQPDPASAGFFVTQLLSGYASQRQGTALAIDTSAEYRALVITADYSKLLNRPASNSEINFWNAQLAAGLTQEGFQAEVAGSNEYFQRAGLTNTTWLQSVYQNFLNRPLDQVGANFYGGLLNQGASRTSVALMILQTTEYRSILGSNFVRLLLQRQATQSDIGFAVTQLGQGATDEQVMAQIMTSQEYFTLANP